MTPKSKSGTKIAVAKKSLKVQIGAPRSGAGGQALPFSPGDPRRRLRLCLRPGGA